MNAIPHKHAEKIKQWADAPEWWDVYRIYENGTRKLTWESDLITYDNQEFELRKSAKHPDNIKPKKKLIDWSKMPRGTMTNRGEFMRVFSETKAITWVLNGIDTPLIFELRLAEQTQFTYWGGGKCPVPDGVVVEVEFCGDCERFVYSDPSELVGWGEADRKYEYSVIAYRITGLADGWTDNPEEAV